MVQHTHGTKLFSVGYGEMVCAYEQLLFHFKIKLISFYILIYILITIVNYNFRKRKLLGKGDRPHTANSTLYITGTKTGHLYLMRLRSRLYESFHL